MAAVNGAAPEQKGTMKLENTEKRDTLIAIEKKYQQQWQDQKVFEVDAPSTSEVPYGTMTLEEQHEKYPKFFAMFAYPYTNGTIHLGHAFTASKVEFMTGFQRMLGKRCLFPLGYHCTGLPIKACADKLVAEVKLFGEDFSGYKEDESDAPEVPPAPTTTTTKEDVTKFSGSKSKANAKTIKAKYQFQIMLSQGIPKEELHKFADPQYWLEYFPPLWRGGLNAMGARIDWRRQFVTTNANPYYDAFVRWQMNRLKELDKIKWGTRYTIYSPKDGQPCMDHDRAKGEAVLPQEYVALKLKVKEWSPQLAEAAKGKIPGTASVYFIPATLRPETMYGQTNVFVSPNITYGVFKVSESEYYVFTKRAAWNLAFQGTFYDGDHFPRQESELKPVFDFSGSAAIGTLVLAPLSVHTAGVRILPMDTVIATKGTGVVTSVPSDSPDDYATYRELQKKPEYYKIKKEWVDLEVVPIISTPSYGDLTAKFLIEKLKINSPKDVKLSEAKELAYKEGFYKGTMLLGKYKGQPVEVVKPKIRDELMQEGLAFAYAEPAAQVISRSGDECVTANLPQWFLNYGDQDVEWRDRVIDHLHSKDMNTFSLETLHSFEKVLDWLNRWACARQYGLGSRLPFDKDWLVESLSDSTIYMSYYTIAHYLHGDRFGKTPGKLSIKPEQMQDEVWDVMFGRRDLDETVLKQSGISRADFDELRRAFAYFYPVDARVSGKDLVNNHLTFFLYNHVALMPSWAWPRGIRCNGHLLLNSEKMSKSTGNFMTLLDCITKFGAEATRICLADGGDGIEDANFDETVANATILRLHTLKGWCEEVVQDSSLRQDTSSTIWDRLFINEMNTLVRRAYSHYDATDYKLALKDALYDFIGARDFYRETTIASGVGMQRDLVLKYIELQALVLTPIAPHFSDYIWQEVLKKTTTIQNELWPTVDAVDPALTAAREYVRSTSSNITSAESAQLKKKSKGKAMAYNPKAPKKLTIFAAESYPAWQEKYIDLLREEFEAHTLKDDKALAAKVGKMGETKKAMPFVQNLKRRLDKGEGAEVVFNRKLPFNETEVLQEMVKGLKKTTGCHAVQVVLVDANGKAKYVASEGSAKQGAWEGDLPQAADSTVPGTPTFHFENIQS